MPGAATRGGELKLHCASVKSDVPATGVIGPSPIRAPLNTSLVSARCQACPAGDQPPAGAASPTPAGNSPRKLKNAAVAASKDIAAARTRASLFADMEIS